MPARRVVLVVDDEATTRDVVEAMLEREDVEVPTAGDGETAAATSWWWSTTRPGAAR